MDELIRKLEVATEADQPHLLRKALDYARDQGWISKEKFYQAQRFIDVGASIDAALTLVPVGASVILGFKQTAQTRPWARVGNSEHGADKTGATPAIALVIAALRARA